MTTVATTCFPGGRRNKRKKKGMFPLLCIYAPPQLSSQDNVFCPSYSAILILTRLLFLPNLQFTVDWFEETFGFREKSYNHVRRQFRLEENDTILHSLANGRKFHIGEFDLPSVDELNNRLQTLVQDSNNESTIFDETNNTLEFEHVIGDVKRLLHDPRNEGAVFQAASQFNCLEMPNSLVRPEAGITQYVNDHTQGPTCAVACAGGTIYRNYFVNKYGQGGKKGQQIDCLAEAGEVLGNEKSAFWKMQNGYALPSDRESMFRLKRKIYGGYFMSREALSKIRVGVQWDTEVVKRLVKPGQSHHCVTQVYCSALPISFATNSKMKDFEPFAKLILEAAYQATFAVAAIKALETNQRVDLYLTKVGGGVFGNRSRWVVDAIRKNLRKYEDYPLNVYLVHYGTLEQAYLQGLQGSKEDKNKCLITDYFASNINIAKLIASAASTVCSNDDDTALLTTNTPNYSDESVQCSSSSLMTGMITETKTEDEDDKGTNECSDPNENNNTEKMMTH